MEILYYLVNGTLGTLGSYLIFKRFQHLGLLTAGLAMVGGGGGRRGFSGGRGGRGAGGGGAGGGVAAARGDGGPDGGVRLLEWGGGGVAYASPCNLWNAGRYQRAAAALAAGGDHVEPDR